MKLFRHLSEHVPCEPRVLTIGKFDGVHRGHAAILARVAEVAAQSGARASVLTFEPHPRDFFAVKVTGASAQPRVASLRDTVFLLRLAQVEQMLIQRFDSAFASMSAEEFVRELLVKRLGVQHLLVGEDFRFGKERRGDLALLAKEGKRYGFTTETVPGLEYEGTRISSSAVRAALAEGNFSQAGRLLGRSWMVTGRLVVQPGLREPVAQGGVIAAFHGARRSPLPAGLFAVRVYCDAFPPLSGVLQIARPSTSSGIDARVILPTRPTGLAASVHATLECVAAITAQEFSVPTQHRADSSHLVHDFSNHGFNLLGRRDYV